MAAALRAGVRRAAGPPAARARRRSRTWPPPRWPPRSARSCCTPSCTRRSSRTPCPGRCSRSPACWAARAIRGPPPRAGRRRRLRPLVPWTRCLTRRKLANRRCGAIVAARRRRRRRRTSLVLKEPGDISNPDVPFVGAEPTPGPTPGKKQQAAKPVELPLAASTATRRTTGARSSPRKPIRGPVAGQVEAQGLGADRVPARDRPEPHPPALRRRAARLARPRHRQAQLEAQARVSLSASTPAIEDGRVYVTLLETSKGSGNGRIVCLRFKRRQDPVVARRSPAAASPRRWSTTAASIFGSEGGTVYALDAKSGKQDWTYSAGGAVKGSPTLSDDGVLFFGAYGGSVHAVRARDGARIWSKRRPAGLLRGGNFYATAAVAYGRVYIGATDGRAYSLSAKDGRSPGRTRPAATSTPPRPSRTSPGAGRWCSSAPTTARSTRSTRKSGKVALDAPLGRQDLRLADHRRRHRLLRRPRPRDHDRPEDRAAASVAFRYDIGAYDPIISDGENLYLTGNRSLTALEPRRLFEKRRKAKQEKVRKKKAVARALVSPAWPESCRQLAPCGPLDGGARAADPDARLMAVRARSSVRRCPALLRRALRDPARRDARGRGRDRRGRGRGDPDRADAAAGARRAGRARARARLQPALPARALHEARSRPRAS